MFLEDNSEIAAYLRILSSGIAYPEAAIGGDRQKKPIEKGIVGRNRSKSNRFYYRYSGKKGNQNLCTGIYSRIL
ncbi:hypothetical protein SAMN05216529_11269 [Faecalicatena contorta]|uniref:Uncharacterized protein n=1 Tax=Faecalicatena contorta TaxID=39482 RepID=A0A315ZS61_9FIRM|nr:hypothetical protein A8805_11269 [Faecalicatena contorta]SUQ15419.1 hypothetical protein SAMN05216529_11269 [Faecalicatena contorta]